MDKWIIQKITPPPADLSDGRMFIAPSLRKEGSACVGVINHWPQGIYRVYPPSLIHTFVTYLTLIYFPSFSFYSPSFISFIFTLHFPSFPLYFPSFPLYFPSFSLILSFLPIILSFLPLILSILPLILSFLSPYSFSFFPLIFISFLRFLPSFFRSPYKSSSLHLLLIKNFLPINEIPFFLFLSYFVLLKKIFYP